MQVWSYVSEIVSASIIRIYVVPVVGIYTHDWLPEPHFLVHFKYIRPIPLSPKAILNVKQQKGD
jgi:hypothetical protein